jgi:hypothetical protein
VPTSRVQVNQERERRLSALIGADLHVRIRPNSMKKQVAARYISATDDSTQSKI